ncbi:hypothetical protein B0F90DRAFT_860820 [Multifurca ochricompacta]|uniref:Uncharacterized protein n=1 Tax=Multifurca ochricompacta TaxID=376703 RepID=A0AAD4QKT4_9AGAM|nr:hypothetical protein B0F90DRAFT_860820 [Multifurca ochricompacta]
MSISPPVFPSHPSSLSPSTSSFLSAISSPENGSPVFPEAFRDREVASISPPTLFGRLGTTTREQTPSSSYSTTYSVNSVNSIKSRKNVLYQRCERHEPILLNSMPISNVMDMGGTLNYIASEGPTSLADLERWRLSTRPGPIIEHPSHSDSCGRGRAEV